MFTINVHHYVHLLPGQDGSDPVLAALAALETKMVQAVDDILREVQEAKGVQASTVTLVTGAVTILQDLKAKLDAAVSASDLEAVAAAAADLDQSTEALKVASDALAAAVATDPPQE